MEPVDASTCDESGEATGTSSQGGADRGEAENDLYRKTTVLQPLLPIKPIPNSPNLHEESDELSQ